MTTLPGETPATDSTSPIDHDVAVVGGGAAGLAAAVFTARYGLETAVFDGGKAAITQCAHIENYLGFPGGISPERFLDLGRAQAADEGAAVIDERVTGVHRYGDDGFAVETTGREVVAGRVVVAAAYDGEVLAPLVGELPDPDPFVPTGAGRTTIDGLYVAGWMSDETVHQVGVNAGHGARVGLTLARDDMSDRYWPAVGERYVDWVVGDGRYGGDGWDESVDEWFDREMLPDDYDRDRSHNRGHDHDDDHGHDRDRDEATIDAACADLKAEFLARQIDAEERERRDREGQRQLLRALDDDLIYEYAETIQRNHDN